MRCRPLVPVLVAACLLVAGCAAAGDADASASDATGRDIGADPVAPETDLSGTVWVVESLTTGAGEEPTTSSLTGRPTLVFADGTVTGADGCNRFGAEYSVASDQLEIGGLARTRTGCPGNDDQASHLAAVLEGTSTIAVAGDGVTLTDGDRGLVLRVDRDQAPPADGIVGALAGTSWVLERITDGPDGDGPVLGLAPDADEAVLELYPNGRAAQGSGCTERADVTWTVSGTELRSTYESIIDYDCGSDERWRQDRRVWRVLHAEPTMRLDGDELVVSNLDISLHYQAARDG